MIPPTNMIQDQSDGKEDERDDGETPPQSPATSVTQPETKNQRAEQKKRKLQRLKRSLSFKTKTVRSKSADNFFRSSNDNKTELLCDGSSSSTGHLSTMAPPHSIPPVPPAIPSAPPSSSRSPARNAFELDSAGHCFMEHIFKKPTFCDVCNHMIVGTTAKHVVFLAGNTAKHGLRCKACKMSLHHKCESGVLYMQQRCMGKLPKGFRRYYSSPLLIQEQFGIIKEVMPIACGNKVDPVYEALRMGTSLAQKAKRTSGSESPHSHSTSDLDKVPEEVAAAHSSRHELSRKHSDDVFTVIENGTEPYHQPDGMPEDSPEQTQLQEDDLLNTYVALYSYTPQDTHDLEMRPGERIIVADDSNDDWWKGLIEDRIGFFPSSYAHPLRPGDQVFRCSRTFIGCKEQGQITLKEGQICVSCEDERSGFIKVSCGKRIGHVPCDVLENI